ncbi:Fis family transcriptional regulator [Komagataeibacter rhaeticus]|uniref:helix-turn-helix domain-containing protein n=1 Tax=Komagataeibacter rhaeticus TaxID=215221 RepID=UPI0005584B94|nr:helix-turn-helix domain-containing protein [Komagataeibacter rhaeticus]MBL7240075.1 Fis family transcriptional regulator [Komagataeibacter rhaeticus]PYD54762.1 Fis family transcriptional regulator [Komagataeibacter rhaeticus]GBQ10807.1 Fis family transcriptional regulator [Komagataeibacter rhaeticus DSM 16663]
MKRNCTQPAAIRPAPVAEKTPPGEIERSWQRCAGFYHLDPAQAWTATVLSGAEFRHVSGRSAALVRIALPEMRHLFTLLRGLDLMVLLADADAMILARCVDETQLSASRRLYLRRGAIWNERVAGTNGIGTSVEAGRPIVLGPGEHWRFCLARLTSFAVPLFDARGRMAGALNLAALAGTATRPVAALLLDVLLQAGRRIEELLFRACYPDHRILSLGVAQGCSTPLIALDARGDMAGATRAARMLTGWTEDTGGPPSPHDGVVVEEPDLSFRQAEANVIRAGLARCHGNATATARNLGISRATLYRKMRYGGIR